MKTELFQELKNKYPSQFKNLKYIGCGDGWYEIISSSCSLIQSHLNHRIEKPIDFYWTQIKEKFGGLRFYYDGGDDMVEGMVHMAESWAANACETCGKPGKSRSGGWIRTLCDEHEEEQQKRIKELDGEE